MIIEIGLSKNVLIKNIYIAMKSEILLVILLTFILITNQIYIYLHFGRKNNDIE